MDKNNLNLRNFIVLLGTVLLVSLCTSVKAQPPTITVGTDSIYISANFLVKNYGSTCDSFLAEGIYIKAWNPNSSCSAQPTDTVKYTRNQNFAHFKILNSDGSCVLLNGRLDESSFSTGSHLLVMKFPINQTLTESDFLFGGSSYFSSIDIYWQESGFQLERGQTYLLQLTEQTQNCSDGDGEDAKLEEEIEPACQTDDCCDEAGDANHNGATNILDLNYLINYFNRTGPAPTCWGEGDANGDCSLDFEDVDYLVDRIFHAGPAPVCPSQ